MQWRRQWRVDPPKFLQFGFIHNRGVGFASHQIEWMLGNGFTTFLAKDANSNAPLDAHQVTAVAQRRGWQSTLDRSLSQARSNIQEKGLSGDALERQARHRVFPGNRPSTTLVYERLDPYTLGQIIALYEHRVFVEGVILGINSYDQWGVELGKELATSLQPVIEGVQSTQGKDSSTAALVDYLITHRD